MNRTTWTILLGVVAMALLAQYALTQSCVPGYSPFTPPTIGDIQTQCVEQYPLPQDRTDVGIGEDVLCWIDTSTWTDTDVYTDSYCNQSWVSDTLGAITWSVSGPGTISPTVTYDSTPVTLTIDLLDADDVVTVNASVTDSGLLGVDPPQQKGKAVNAKVPTGAVILQATDNPPAAWQAGGNAQIGAATAFLFQVQPNTVNLNKTQMQVAFAGNAGFVWPDGTPMPIAGFTWGPWKTQSIGATPNLQTRDDSAGLYPIRRLAGQNTNFINAGQLQWLNANGKPRGASSYSFVATFQGANNPPPGPTAGQTQVGNMAAVGNGNPTGIWGGWQGPWK